MAYSDLDEVVSAARCRGRLDRLDIPAWRLFEHPDLSENDASRVMLALEDNENLLELLENQEMRRWLATELGPRCEQAVCEILLNKLDQPQPGVELQPLAYHVKRLVPGLPADELSAWADRHGVTFWLTVSVGNLFRPRDRWMLAVDPRLPIGDVLSTRTAVPPPKHSFVWTVIDFLERRAAAAAAAIVGEQAWLDALKRPQDAQLGGLFDEMLAMRSEIRRLTAPQDDRKGGVLSIEERPLRLACRFPLPAPCGGGYRPVVDLILDNAGRSFSLVCNCRTASPVVCDTRLDALDGMIESLGRPAKQDIASQLAEILRVPLWRRELVYLKRSAESRQFTWKDEPVELGWQLQDGRGGELDLEPVLCRPAKRGTGWVTKKLSMRRLIEERDCCQRVADSELAALFEMFSNSYQPNYALALRLLIGHPRVFWKAGPTKVPITVHQTDLTLRLDPTGDDRISIVASLAGQRYDSADFEGIVELGEYRQYLSEVNYDSGRLEFVSLSPGMSRILGELTAAAPDYPTRALPELLGYLQGLGDGVQVELSEELCGAALDPEQRLRARLSMRDSGLLEVALLAQPLSGAESFTPGRGPRQVAVNRDGEIVVVHRDPLAEQRLAGQLVERLGLTPTPEYSWAIDGLEPALILLEALEQCGESLVVEWRSDRNLRLSRGGTANDLRIQVSARRDWFTLGGALELDGTGVPLAALLEAVRQRSRFVEVKPGVWHRIEGEIRRTLEPLAELSDGEHGERIPRLAAPIVDALAEQGAQIEAPQAWSELCERMRRAGQVDPPLPTNLHATLRSYQLEGYRWMARLAEWSPGACLADDMGLGKTVQALALLLQRAERGPALVVAPTSVGFNWAREAERFAPELIILRIRRRSELDLLQRAGKWHLAIVSYDLLTRNLERFIDQEWATLVLDEAQAIKNPSTARAKAIFRLRREFCLALTGTPVENRTGELWSIFHATTPGILGSKRWFRKRFALPIEKDGDTSKRAALAQLIRPFVLRREKRAVAPELPERTEVTLHVTLTPSERALYNTLRKSALEDLADTEREKSHEQRFLILAAMTRLRQLSCDPRLLDRNSAVTSSKTEALLELLETLAAEGNRALVFSQFTSYLALIREALDSAGMGYRYLDGQTPAAKRQQEVDSFQRGDGSVFLLSLKAGGVGLNLTAASYVILLDPWWNPAVETQAADRAHRIGQTRPVTIYRLVANDTIEETILDLQQQKRELFSALLDGTSSSAPLTTDQLLALLADPGLRGGR